MKNWVLLIINFIAAFFIIEILFSWNTLIPIDKSQFEVDKINSTVLNLCTGAIVSTFFYYILVFFPNKWQQKNIRKIISPNLKMVADYMQKFFANICHVNNIEDFGEYYSQIKDKCLENITFSSIDKTDFCFIRENDKESSSIMLTSQLEFALHTVRVNGNIIDSIFSLPYIHNAEFNLLSLLADIQKASFKENISFLNSVKNVNGSVSNLNKSLIEYYQLYKTLLIYVKPDKIRKAEKNSKYIPIEIRVK